MQDLWKSVRVRAFQESDIDQHIAYWHNPENTFLEDLGVERQRLIPAHKMREQLQYVLNKMPQACSLLTIEYQGQAIGVHELTDIVEQESGVMHASIWTSEFRGLGIGKVSYVKAMQWYFEHLPLQRILFKTPKNNRAANKLKQTLKIKQVGECTYELPIFGRPIEAHLYEMTRSAFEHQVALAAPRE
ncbi:GNAT family protein [Pseudoalteromonas rubra]|uniref:GNAT family N-acetyltransferase n=1 Tax=Pseudoalteromonas rubra TaxID=43658 RepID=UPI002DB6F097|nr:GNAT family protein [Pseudoalteromonas rubra]MEC4090168.1 GNAT family protein [Pseudoalteromonas rubra]